MSAIYLHCLFKKKRGFTQLQIFKTDYPRFLKSYRCIHYSIKDLGWRVRLQQETGYHQQLAVNLLTRRHPLIDHKVKQESIPVGCIPPPANLTVVHVSVATRCQHQYGGGSTSRNGAPVQWESMSGARKGSSAVRSHVCGGQGKGSLYSEIPCLWAGLGPRRGSLYSEVNASWIIVTCPFCAYHCSLGTVHWKGWHSMATIPNKLA